MAGLGGGLSANVTRSSASSRGTVGASRPFERTIGSSLRSAIGGWQRVQVHLLDRAEHRPDEVILRQPISQRRRQQERLAAVTRDEVLTHPGMVLNRADDTA